MGKKLVNARISEELHEKITNSNHNSKSECINAALDFYFDHTENTENTQGNNSTDERVQDLKDYIETLKAQLEHKDNQIYNLNIGLNSVSQKLHTKEQKKEKPRLTDRLKFWK